MTTSLPQSYEQNSDQITWQRAWRKICLNIDGISLGSTISALVEHGVLDILANASSFSPVAELAAHCKAKPAYMHLAFKLLSSQGLVQRCQDDTGKMLVKFTPDGHAWYPLRHAYHNMTSLLTASNQFRAMLGGKMAEDPRILNTLEASLTPPVGDTSDDVRKRVHLHCLGPGVAASLTALVGASPAVDRTATLPVRNNLTQLGYRLLAAQGWVSPSNDGYSFTEEGKMVCQVVGQYNMAFCYIPTFQQVPQRIFPDQIRINTPIDELDAHLDRQLDIEFSGEVFSRHCRSPLLQLTLPLFDQEPCDTQPKLLVDTGCGDGSLLAELYIAIRDQTRRGSSLSSFPLLAVGADVSPIARETTAKRLAAANIPHLVVEGDIGHPEQLATELENHGHDLRDALHLSKSVVHNRRFTQPSNTNITRLACTDGVFIAEDDSLIDGAVIEQNLVEHFRAWAPWTQQHGMVIIEAHNLPTEVSATLVGRSVISMLEASHGYSRQYPIEAKCHRAMAREAGFRTLATRDLVSLGGHPLLTLDHLIPVN